MASGSGLSNRFAATFDVDIRLTEAGYQHIDEVIGLFFQAVNMLQKNGVVEQGQKVAIIGRTAAGKSTIADLILRMYDPTKGSIMVDGISLQDYELTSLRENIAYVPQDVFLFSDTIEANIKFGSQESSREVVEQYARHAAVYEDIMGLPEGFDTRIGERGITLSGGQKQRISIARALIKHPEFVILDDCLSAVDTQTEHTIIDFLNRELSNKTAIIITHRILGMLDYDKILVTRSCWVA